MHWCQCLLYSLWPSGLRRHRGRCTEYAQRVAITFRFGCCPFPSSIASLPLSSRVTTYSYPQGGYRRRSDCLPAHLPHCY
ncbi:MFS transporter, SP family, solute carrier family 2 (myo-inositol transporter), member 13 [Cryptococcus neoformans]|nr:MFS transporter, SP family, solute carrier family 2 (myo-inositol transporter), member 13 [Cryptococcus neoformans var. grubii]